MSSSNSKIKNKKILIIRFSSFGDIVFTMSTLSVLKDEIGENGQIDWLVRSDMQGVLTGQNIVSKVYSFDRSLGITGLIKLAYRMRKEKYDIIYDAHANLRSFIVRRILLTFSKAKLIIRKKERLKRFLLFKLRINRFDFPYKAMLSFLRPLESYLEKDLTLKPMNWISKSINLDIAGKVILVPSAAWKMKRWPVSYWIDLISYLPNYEFMILGGPDDKFCADIKNSASDRVENLAGHLSLSESCSVVSKADFVITGDTGLAQVADLTGRNGLTLIGPTAFGHPTMGTMHVLERSLACRPCTKDGSGHCSQEVYQKCLIDILPQDVALKVKEYFPKP